jgi:hypothetical protein
MARKLPLRFHLLGLVCPLASAARSCLAHRARFTSSDASHHSLHLVSLSFAPHSASAPLDLVSRSISCLCIGIPKYLLSLVLRTAVTRYGHRRHEICAPLPRHCCAASTSSRGRSASCLSLRCCRAASFAGAWCNLPRAARSPQAAKEAQGYETPPNMEHECRQLALSDLLNRSGAFLDRGQNFLVSGRVVSQNLRVRFEKSR